MGILGRLRLLLPRRGTRTSVELDPVQQWTVLTLLQHGECSFRRLHAEVDAIRGATPADMVVAVMKLERDGVLERRGERSSSRQRSDYVLTPAGRRLARLIPRPPRSVISFYL